ncbi:MAG TPA: YggS family pyridoxal phosphate-dependent enzyme [Aeromicrobium sp.]|nr:YggS family pyridoxal phosphate-dependent enzyme [Aeromicrobium sp.]
MSRRQELARNLESVQAQIAAACHRAGRSVDEVTLVVVTKTYPAADVETLFELGVRDVGENRHQEAVAKFEEVHLGSTELRWHFLGGLQTNKAAAVVKYADLVHSLDRLKLAQSLSRAAEAAERTIDCLIQVDFDTANPARAGVPAGEVLPLAEQVLAQAPNVQIAGLMTVAPLGAEPAPSFEALQLLGADLVRLVPTAKILSAGMSGDFETAIEYGATHLRVGRLVLGQRL